MAPREVHFEPFLHLAGLAADRALIAWGGFSFARRDDAWRLLDDEELRSERPHGGRTGTIGAESAPYGRAVVEVTRDGRTVARAETAERNWAWLTGLEPGAEHRYRVLVDGEEWAAGELWDWDLRRGTLAPSGRSYDNRFRTFPAPGARTPVAFAVMGDFGVGIVRGADASWRQMRLAEALERAVDDRGLALVLTVGDNVYLGEEGDVAGSGDEDADWYSSFYAPYRHVLNRVPFFPAVGNHDTSDTERADDRRQLADNLFLDHRFGPEVERGRASLDPGLFYRFDVGGTLGFVAIDTTCADELDPYDQYFQEPRHAAWLRDALARDDGPPWLIPFSHHPPFCAGPSHPNTQPMIDDLVPLFRRAGVRLVLSGHEHNFQHARHEGTDYIVSGAAGKLSEEPPDAFERAHTRSWAVEGHFLLARADERRIEIEPVGGVREDGSLRPIALSAPDGSPVPTPLRIERD